MAQGPGVDVYADVVCPFAHVSLHRLFDARRAAGAEAVAVRVHAWPLEIVNGVPLARDHVAAEIVDLRDQVAGDLFVGFDADAFPDSSVAALGLTLAAYDLGPAVGEAMTLAVRDALFEQGRPIGDPDVLAAVAADLDVTLPDEAEARARVEADLAAGRERGVVGSPHFFLGAEDWFCPGLQIERRGEHFRIDVDAARFEAFLAAAFGG